MKQRALYALGLAATLTAYAAPTPTAAPQSAPSPAPTPAPMPIGGVPSAPVSIPAVAPPQIVVNVPKQEISPWYQDVWKALLGTFLGAFLAFFSAVIHRRTQQTNVSIAAGNMALFHLRAMHRQTTEMRLGVRSDIKDSGDTVGRLPEWALLRPSINKPDASITIDFALLSFLTDTPEGQNVLLHVRHAQELFQRACHSFDLQQESAISYQEKIHEVVDSDDIFVDRVIKWDLLEEKLGRVLVGNRKSYFFSYLRNIEVNPMITRNSYTLLQDELVRRFGSKAWNLKVDPSPTDNRAEANLPALPAHLEQYINHQRELEQKVRAQAGDGGQSRAAG